MNSAHADLHRPIRAVLFCGPRIERVVIRFICALEEHPEVEFLGGFCQSNGQTFTEKVKDLWQRRGVLGLPILAAEAEMSLGRYIAHPRSELKLRRQAAWITDKIAVVPDIHAKEVLARI